MAALRQGWRTWKEFRSDQQEITLLAGSVAHIPVRIRYIDQGEPAQGTLLLMHGIPTWGYLYHGVIPTLVEAGYRVIAPDFLGHGWSDRRDRFDRSFQDQACMIVTLLEALDISTVDVDPWQKAEDGQRLASEIPGARFQPIEGASHWIQQDDPERVSRELLAFLQSSASR